MVKIQSKEVQLATRLTVDQAKAVTDFAETFGMSVSAVIRLAVLRMLESKADPVNKPVE